MLPAFLIVAALLAAIAGLTWSDPAARPAPPAPTPVSTIADRVEELRGLRFDRRPEPLEVSAAQARREGLADFDRAYPVQRRRAEEAFYVRLGLLPPGTDLREAIAAVFGEQVSGYYDPRNGRLRVVADGGGDRVLDEMTLAHELVHALEDQAIGLDDALSDAGDDRGHAYRALVEGTAMHTALAYLDAHFDAEVALGALLAGSLGAPSTDALPDFLVEALSFPYVAGRAFVSELERRGGWRLVDTALRERPPRSTEQVLHPAKWRRREAPLRVALPSAHDLGPPDATGTFGEWQTRELLETAGGLRAEAAAGWGGDAYASWDEGVVLRWRWDTRRDALEFRRALTEVAQQGALRGAVEIAARGDRVTLAVAERAALARRLAAAP